MHCPNCDGSKTHKFFVERIPCNHCDEEVEVVYYACNDCNLMWKAVGGVIVNNSFDAPEELEQFLDADLPEDIEQFLAESLDDWFNDIPVTEVRITGNNSMQDMIHRCLRCGVMSYETKPKKYHCPDCGFEWEVL